MKPIVVRHKDVPTYKLGDAKTKILIDEVSVETKNLSLGWISFPPNTKTPEHSRTVEEIIYITKGKARVVTNDEQYELNLGDSIHIPPGIIHRHENPSNEPMEQIWIFSPAGPEKMIRENEIDSSN
jgi:quercetin dioxygenase-like cupin family protein